MNFNLKPTLIQRTALLAFVLNVIVISGLAFSANADVPTISTWDKANHFLAFWVLTCVLAFCYKKPTEKMLIKVVLPLIAYGFFIEVVQSFLPSRYFSLLDVVADCVGIVLGLISVFFVNFLAKRFIRKAA